MSDLPRMLYKKGDETAAELHGLRCDTMVVDSAEDEAAALSDGWRYTPAEAHGKTPLKAKPVAADGTAEDERNGLLQEIEQLHKQIVELDQRVAAAEKERDETRELLKAFDADGDGKPGGSKPKLGIKTDQKAA